MTQFAPDSGSKLCIHNSPFVGTRHRACMRPGSVASRFGQSIDREQVSFQWKNPNLLIRNPDFLIKNPDFLLKDLDFIIQHRGRGESSIYAYG